LTDRNPPRLWSLDGVIFDMDGVVTDTATAHARSWQIMFDDFCGKRSQVTGEPFRPFTEQDYLVHVDGKPRYDGVRSFLESRGIELPEGAPDDPPEAETVCGLGNRKNRSFLAVLEDVGAEPYQTTVDLAEELQRRGILTAVISSSRNSQSVLEAAGVIDLFPVRVDGFDCARLGLPGKPDPAILLEAARRMGIEPARAAVIEDALTGVAAGRRGGFGLVVGVDRSGQGDQLEAHGADVVVTDLADLFPPEMFVDGLPSATAADIDAEIGDRRPAVFLDYDGTLTGIAQSPEEAVLSESSREALLRLARRWPVAIVSGRDRADVELMVGVDSLYYAGSHGFDISGPDGFREQRGGEFRASLEAAADQMEAEVTSLEGVWVERKLAAVAVHYRQGGPGSETAVGEAAREVAARHPDLRVAGGKKIVELRPNIDWDKGKAVLWLLETLDLAQDDVVPVYVGDDETDEDAFRALADHGIGVVVGEEHRPTRARYALADPDQVKDFLNRLAGIGSR
jgi:alpha,alpha-trehalase